MARRFNRRYARVPADLVSMVGSNQYEEAGSIIDFSRGGLRVQTGPRLVTGQVLHLLLEGQAKPFACCRVVWAQTHGGALPSEAGLEILENPPWIPTARMNFKAAVWRDNEKIESSSLWGTSAYSEPCDRKSRRMSGQP
jgi:PilZ domain